MFVTSVVPASEIVEGDFTTLSGFRRVCGIQPVTHTTGRGRNKRTTITAINLIRYDGSHDSVYPDAMVTVRRPVTIGPA